MDTNETPTPPGTHGRSTLWRESLNWTRWLHVYTSMIALLLVLFFGITGITLNHPDWTFGFDPSTETVTGSLPTDAIAEDGTVQFLIVSEFLRDEHGVKSDVADFGTDSTDGFISYKGPGYSADAFFDLSTGAYDLTVEQQGWVGILNDLHKGRDTDTSWNWLIDVSGGILVAIALTGLGLQLFLKKRRRSALIVVGVGIAISSVFTVLTIN